MTSHRLSYIFIFLFSGILFLLLSCIHSPQRDISDEQRSELLLSSLIKAVESNNIQKVKETIHAGADVNGTNRYIYYPPLVVASSHGRYEIAKLLIDSGADVNKVDFYNGAPPICWAAVTGYSKVVKLLVEHGAEINKEDYSGMAAIDYAYAKGYAWLYHYLKNSGGILDWSRVHWYKSYVQDLQMPVQEPVE